MQQLTDAILRKYKKNWEKFFVVTLTGSVSVGKSTISKQLAQSLERSFPGLTVSIMSVDSFIYPNRVLQERGIFNQKGFPESYDLQALSTKITDLRAGQDQIEIPLYRQEINDIDASQTVIVKRPKILIVEGVTALRLKNADYAIYIDADEKDIYQWFLKRTLAFIRENRQIPGSFYYTLSKKPVTEIMSLIQKTWIQTNLKNLKTYIEPQKSKTDAIIHKKQNHEIDRITFQK
ncbi:pantothenate kinase [Oenococcus kitaharae]|nr:pantothenate kinase [Oenococcus kitaharae]OEY85484.1 pantothenate kinase [Oenococcus kitaharae]OEY86338.1 pantothenate kinase [Oenococcus kitaharae]